MGYAGSPFRDFESYPGIEIGLDDDDIQLISSRHLLELGYFEECLHNGNPTN